jgi:hypothetical protein
MPSQRISDDLRFAQVVFLGLLPDLKPIQPFHHPPNGALGFSTNCLHPFATIQPIETYLSYARCFVCFGCLKEDHEDIVLAMVVPDLSAHTLRPSARR